jgi:lycopene beta-cyclase
MESTVYDYAIVGAGAAGLHVALALAGDSYFKDKRILILEKDSKDTNDRTWCFWEKDSDTWDTIVARSWKKASFMSAGHNKKLDLGSYEYKKIRAIDFYDHAKKQLEAAGNFKWLNEEVVEIREGVPNMVVTRSDSNYLAGHVFDSRIAPSFFESKDKYIRLLQHFKGWVIETEDPIFEPDRFVMMDFRLKYPGSTSFTYILPDSPNRALVEFTFFSPSLVKDAEYEQYLRKYIEEVLGVKKYKVMEKEHGVIPMSDYPFHRVNNHFVTKIGTAGSWVKGSSGYSFKNAERYSKKILNNIKSGRMPGVGLFKKRFRQYDRVFLDVLYNNNHKGEDIFSDMYTKNEITKILAFLDEQTTLSEELRIIGSFEWKPFTKALLKQLVT